MKKSISIKNKIILACVAMLLLFVSAFAFIMPSSPVGAEEVMAAERSSGNIIVTAYDRQTSLPFDETFNPDGQIEDVDYYTFSWRATSKFKVELDKTGLDEPASITYKYSLQYLENLPTHFTTDETVTEDIPGASGSGLTSLDQIPALEYSIDKANGATSLGHEWGIYRFILSINGTLYRSDFYYVEPDTPPTEDVEIVKKDIQATESMQSAYEFTITSDSCKYINKNLIRWYVKGTTYDSVQYAYHVDDIGSDEFPSLDYKNNALHSAVGDREKGALTFRFETNIAGKWDVYCVIFKEVPSSRVENIASAQSTRSNVINATTGREFQASYIIWIIVAIAVLLLAVIIFIIIKSVKKEKVW